MERKGAIKAIGWLTGLMRLEIELHTGISLPLITFLPIPLALLSSSIPHMQALRSRDNFCWQNALVFKSQAITKMRSRTAFLHSYP